MKQKKVSDNIYRKKFSFLIRSVYETMNRYVIDKPDDERLLNLKLYRYTSAHLFAHIAMFCYQFEEFENFNFNEGTTLFNEIEKQIQILVSLFSDTVLEQRKKTNVDIYFRSFTLMLIKSLDKFDFLPLLYEKELKIQMRYFIPKGIENIENINFDSVALKFINYIKKKYLAFLKKKRFQIE